MTNYEIMYIVRPNLEEDSIKKIHESFVKLLNDNGAKVTESKELGQKQLAYEIKKFKTGYYFLINLEAENDKAIKEFDRLALISEDIIRHLIINLDK
ncbi:MAG: 30S ribosomal protein S6 [Firmicutes bacterium]|nr:30S ribosomal protein S6 [Bacillota bacterium]